MSPTAEASKTFNRSRAVPANNSDSPAKGSSRGWGAYHKAASQLGDAGSYLKVDEERRIILILDEAPFDTFNCHWVESITDGSKSVACWDSLVDENEEQTMPPCPLCRAGDKTTKISVFFNVISLENPAVPTLKIWEMGSQAAKQLADYADVPKTSPLNKEGLYFEVSKAKSGKRVEYRVKDVKARDLEEDYGIAPLSADVIADLAKNKKTGRVKEPLDEKQMREVLDLLP